ncbi:hypothetical protein [Brevundimonas sp. NIBR11]|uniref:hypothetical protein n=1 Tax=Brevundimonas sp. NIBR11 TaxID=3015999 RepID=UPI0022F1431E|nr:hypothetical protein [Brevundimonas sp. NIBR11]WGM30220.1 hypothetical protein KKHFBJBL_00436 [Brevundimonas sp. NIBR11]
MLLAAMIALALSGQDAPPPPAQNEGSVQLPTVEVQGALAGMNLETRIDDFVGSVAAPISEYGYGPARWHRDVCVGAINFQPAAARAIVDRVSSVAVDLGLRSEDPGCDPQVLIVATNDGPGTATGLVERRRRFFVLGGEGMDLGRAALARFQSNDHPVRWWHVSLPVDADTGGRIVRLPGDSDGAINPIDPFSAVIIVDKFIASRIYSERRDNLIRAVIIVDTTRLGEATFAQLADYVAMIAMAQIDPEVDVRGHDSVLNLFRNPAGVQGLTDWDMAYLKGLYKARLDTVSTVSRMGAVEAEMEAIERRRQAE